MLAQFLTSLVLVEMGIEPLHHISHSQLGKLTWWIKRPENYKTVAQH